MDTYSLLNLALICFKGIKSFSVWYFCGSFISFPSSHSLSHTYKRESEEWKTECMGHEYYRETRGGVGNFEAALKFSHRLLFRLEL